jgi:hypothetical protein
MLLRMLPCLAAALAITGCATLLPRGTSDTPSTFDSFAQAQAAATRIVPFGTRVPALKALGFDPDGSNVTLIPYPEIVGRLAPYPGVPVEALAPGIRQCLQVQSECSAYLFHFERQDRHREGSFWLDFLNIRRITQVRGWWFETLVVVHGEDVLFRNVAGQPHTDRVERQTNPLGPFQPAGEVAGTALLR